MRRIFTAREPKPLPDKGGTIISAVSLSGQVVIVTGASSGIGAATALACGAEGMRVALAARREELLRPLAEQVEAAGGEALVCPTDMRVREQIEALAESTIHRFGRVDILLANAGLGYTGPMAQITDEQIVETVTVNLLGVIRCAHAVLPGMIERRSGHVITVSSVAAGLASPRAAVYGASKAGVHRFCEGLRREVTRHGIHVTDVLPGVIDTPMTARLTGMPKAPVESTARAILGVIRRPRRSLVTPGWYRMILALNYALPWVVDRGVARWMREEPGG